LTVQEGDSTVSTAITTLDFGSGFDVTESPAGEANISLDLSEGSVGTLPIGSGGTGQSTATAAFDALAPTTTAGDIMYHDGTDNVRLAAGTRYFQKLTTGGTSAAPTWQNTWYTIYATTRQDKTNNTLTDDDTLKLDTTIYGTGTYVVRLFAYLESTDANADVTFGHRAASGTFTAAGYRQHTVPGGSTNTFSIISSPDNAGVNLTATVTGICRVQIDIRLVCTVAGVWCFRFAQAATTANRTSRLSGSYIEFMKVE